jgi:peptidoglycan/LPS O-acetylase OafA/YrhL
MSHSTDETLKHVGIIEPPTGKGPVQPNTARPEKHFDDAQRTYIDVLRVMAVNLVVYAHLTAIFEMKAVKPNGLGVVMSFLLSGFLIFSTAWSRNNRDGSGLTDFLIDRASRIFVPLLPALLLVVLANVFLIQRNWGQEGVNEGVLAFFGNLFLFNDYPVFQALSRFVDVKAFHLRQYNSAEPFWTIPIEFWTYVLFGILFFCWYRGEKMSKWFATIAVLIAAPVFIWNSFAGGGKGLTLVWILGALFAYLWMNGLGLFPRRAAVGAVMICVGLVGLGGAVMQAGFFAFRIEQAIFVSVILFGSLLLVSRCSPLMRMLRIPAGFSASYTYSLFLMHNPVMIVIRENTDFQVTWGALALVFLACHIVAYGLYLISERHYKRVGAWVKGRLRARRKPVAAEPVITLNPSRGV